MFLFSFTGLNAIALSVRSALLEIGRKRKRRKRRRGKGWKTKSGICFGDRAPPLILEAQPQSPSMHLFFYYHCPPVCHLARNHLLSAIKQQQMNVQQLNILHPPQASSSSLRHTGWLAGVRVFSALVVIPPSCPLLSTPTIFATPTLLSSCESTLVWHKHCTGNTVCKVLSKIYYYHYYIIMMIIIIIIIITHLQLYM